jgi:hypothetical protein
VTAANLKGRHDLAEIIGYAWRIYMAHFRTLFLIALAIAPVVMLLTITVRRIEDPAMAQVVGGWLQVPLALVALVVTAGIVRAVDDIASGTAPEPGRSLDVGLQKFWPIFTASLLAGVRMFLAVFAVPFLAIYWLIRRDATIDGRRDWYFAVIPLALLFYLFVRWAFVPYAAVVDDKRSWPALDASAEAVRGQWWRTFGILIVIQMLFFSAVVIGSISSLGPPLVEGTITAVAYAFALPVVDTAQTLLYYDLKARKGADVSSAPVATAESDL